MFRPAVINDFRQISLSHLLFSTSVRIQVSTFLLTIYQVLGKGIFIDNLKSYPLFAGYWFSCMEHLYYWTVNSKLLVDTC